MLIEIIEGKAGSDASAGSGERQQRPRRPTSRGKDGKYTVDPKSDIARDDDRHNTSILASSASPAKKRQRLKRNNRRANKTNCLHVCAAVRK